MAIARYELTMTLSIMLNQARGLIRSQGYLFPYLYILNRGTPVNIEMAHPTIVGIDAEEASIEKGDDHIYRTVVGCKIADEKDDIAIGQIAEKIATEHNPDAIALYISCVYNEFRKGDIDNELLKFGALHLDPDAIRVIHVCAFSRTDEDPIMTNIPYVHRGQIKTLPGDETAFDVTFVEYPWTKPLSKLSPKLLDPYRLMR